MELKAEIYQFLSRTNIPNTPIGIWKNHPKQRPDITAEVEYRICDKPFEINFANVVAEGVSIGAYQYIDPHLDKFMSRRWPKCIKGEAHISSTASDLKENEILAFILKYLRLLIWDVKERPECPKIIKEAIDQTATTKGYRREYFCGQIFDFDGNRVPSGQEKYVPSEKGAYTGPGLVYILDLIPYQNIDELVWSSIIPFPNRIDIKTDSPAIKKKIDSMRKHFNSYDELEDARNLHQQGIIKPSVRSAASSVDAILRFYCDVWDIKFPKKDISFDLKIEKILAEASKPSYKEADQENLSKLLHLYRARNSMHEGDCYYRNESNEIVYITKISQVYDLINAAESFTLWIDSLV